MFQDLRTLSWNYEVSRCNVSLGNIKIAHNRVYDSWLTDGAQKATLLHQAHAIFSQTLVVFGRRRPGVLFRESVILEKMGQIADVIRCLIEARTIYERLRQGWSTCGWDETGRFRFICLCIGPLILPLGIYYTLDGGPLSSQLLQLIIRAHLGYAQMVQAL